MFATAKEKEASKINGVGVMPPMSASDQRIEYRPFASAMKITLDGEEFMIRPPSMHVSNIIKQFINDRLKKLREHSEVFVNIIKQFFDEIKSKLDDETLKNLKSVKRYEKIASSNSREAILDAYDQLQDEFKKISNAKDIIVILNAIIDANEKLKDEQLKITDMSDRDMFRFVQLIILDGKNKKWREEYETFPPDEMLEKEGIPYKRLYRHADVAELQVLLDVYNQMNKPEYARKNFQALSPMV